ncbi:MAG: hypothetical protein ACYS7Y_32380, partial [Planctomycetota bacterium]
FIKVDPTTDTVTEFGDVPTDLSKWAGAVLGPNGVIYGIPLKADTFLRLGQPVDIQSDSPLSRHWNMQ